MFHEQIEEQIYYILFQAKFPVFRAHKRQLSKLKKIKGKNFYVFDKIDIMKSARKIFDLVKKKIKSVPSFF